jgi:hypothetical protein
MKIHIIEILDNAEPDTEIIRGLNLESKVRPVRRADNLPATCEPIV